VAAQTADDSLFFYAGKKGKKKGQTLNLTEFLGGDGGAYRAPGSGATTTVAVSSTWADEMDEAEVEDSRGYRQQQVLSLLYRIDADSDSLNPASDSDFPWIRVQESSPAFADLESRHCGIWIQAAGMLNPDLGFAESGIQQDCVFSRKNPGT
jgi:hypothetical protein